MATTTLARDHVAGALGHILALMVGTHVAIFQLQKDGLGTCPVAHHLGLALGQLESAKMQAEAFLNKK